MQEKFDRIGIMRNWPEYEIVEVLGQGAYGKVYKIRKDYLGSTLFSAVKVIHIPKDPSMGYELQSEGMTRQQIDTYYKNQVHDFLRENTLMEEVKGAANIVTTEDCIAEKDPDGVGYTIYIKMELLESFENLLRIYELDSSDIVRVGCDICDALTVCEKKNIVHRDIKPANVFVNEFGTYKLGDFGVARQLEHEYTQMTQIGTSMYMAPELYTEGKADNRVDIYSLGIMLYRLGNKGRFPFIENITTKPDERQEALFRRLKGETLPLPSDVDSELGNIILKACAHDAEERYTTAGELKHALERWRFEKEFGPEYLEKMQEEKLKKESEEKKEGEQEEEAKDTPQNNQKNQENDSSGMVALVLLIIFIILVLIAETKNSENQTTTNSQFVGTYYAALE